MAYVVGDVPFDLQLITADCGLDIGWGVKIIDFNDGFSFFDEFLLDKHFFDRVLLDRCLAGFRLNLLRFN
jgi:cyanophycinase-like exopeptidase